MNNTVVIGIDPGIRGAIAVISSTGKCLTVIPVPTIPVNDKVEVDIKALSNILADWNTRYRVTAVMFEHVHAMPKQGVTSMFTFGKTYGMLIGCFSTYFNNICFVSPLVWKKAILPRQEGGYDKQAAITHCIDNYPAVNLLPGRLRKPHDGMAEAVCIAEYCLKTKCEIKQC